MNRIRRMPNPGWLFLLITIVYAVSSIVFLIGRDNTLNKAVDGWVEQAAEASDPDVVIDRLSKAKAGMERYDITSGHTAILLKNPTNDLTIVYDDLESLIARTERIAGMEDRTQREVAFNDVRDILSWEINDVSGSVIWHQWGFWALWGTVSLLVLATIIGTVWQEFVAVSRW